MNKGRTILILTNRVPYPLKDGGALAIHAMIKGWHDAGWQVHVLAMNTSRHYVAPGSFPSFYKRLAGFETVDIDNGIKVIPTLRNLLFSRKPQHAERFYSEQFGRKLVDTIKEIQPGVIQMESIYLSEYLPAIRQHSTALVIQRLHNVEYQIWQRLAAEKTNPLKKMYLSNLSERIKKYEQRVWNEFDILLPITLADAAVINASGGTATMLTAPFGIDLSHLPLLITECWNGYHIGAMEWMPNLEGIEWFIKDIWPEVHQQAPGFHFYFAGRHMPEQLRQLNVEGLHCVGEVADANAFIADKKILIVPLKSGSGIRVKTLEAMAAGKIVISTTVGIQGIEAKNKVHFLEANTPAEFAAAIRWCLDHRDEAEQIAANARALIRTTYNQQLIMEKVTSLVEGKLGRREEGYL